MEYKLESHGDWLEKEAYKFIHSSIPTYELIWQRFIGHKGNGKMADMEKIEESDEKIRMDFSEHHYTVLESLYFMKRIVDDESERKEINSFDLYRKVINQVMAFQAYSGRLRDNIKKCFSLVSNKEEANLSCVKMDAFYKQRHVFIHGKKVPFGFDSDKLFKIAVIKKETTDRIGYGLEMPWNTVNNSDLEYLIKSLSKTMEELIAIVEGLLNHLFSFVKHFIELRKLLIIPPESYLSNFDNLDSIPSSGSIETGRSGYSGNA
jgi:hypothetical protein